MKKKVLSMLVLLMTAVTGAWATEPKVYDSGEVEVYSLELGDILLPGVTLTKGSYSTDVVAGAGRYFRDGQIQSGGDVLALYPITIGANGVINNKYNGADNTTDYTPITAEGEVGNAWEVTYVDAPFYRPGYKEIRISGIKYTPAAPAGYTVSMKEGTVDADKWTITPNPATAGTQVKATYGGTKKVKSVKAKKKAGAKTLAEATTDDIGKIIGADGKIYATKAAAEAVATGNAVAMIAYVGTASDCTHGLAIALADESGSKNYGAAGTACSGKAAVTGGTYTWRLPSEKDWQYMFIGCGSSESYSAPTWGMIKSYSGLVSKLATAQGEALQCDDYWSSTECDYGQAWSVYFDVDVVDGSIAKFYENDEGENEFRVRACLAF